MHTYVHSVDTHTVTDTNIHSHGRTDTPETPIHTIDIQANTAEQSRHTHTCAHLYTHGINTQAVPQKHRYVGIGASQPGHLPTDT